MATHTVSGDVLKRLKRAQGHLSKVLQMLEAEEDCLLIAQQLQAVVNAISAAKTIHVQDHIEHCLADALKNQRGDAKEKIFEFREIAKYL